MSAPPTFSYMPAPHEIGYYGMLFQAADAERSGSIGGAKAVEFFTRSKIPIDQLKHIWSASDRPPTNSLDHRKFAVAIRLIQLEQNGVKPTGPDLSAVPGNLRPVFIEGIPPPNGGNRPPSNSTDRPPSVGNPPGPTPPSQQEAPHLAPPQQRQLVVQDPYTLTPQEQLRYEQLFPEYTKDSEYVYGGEAVQLFSKSGLSQQQLAQIWNMVDNPVDNRLDKLEFAMAMHLIVCVSRKNLQLPPGLPVSLKQLKIQQQQEQAQQSAPTNGHTQNFQHNNGGGGSLENEPRPPLAPHEQQAPAGGIPSPTRAVQVPTHNPNGAAMTAVSSIGGFSGIQGPPPIQHSSGVSISEAFEGLAGDTGSISSFGAATPIPNNVTTSSFERPEVETVPEDAPVVTAPPVSRRIDTSPPPTTRDLASSYDVGEAKDELGKLRSALQKLQAENISLKAKLGTMTDEELDVQKELSATVAEITKLSGELTTLRAEVLASKSRLLEATSELKASKEKKGVLMDLINEASATKQAMDEAYEGIEKFNEEARSNPAPSQPQTAPPQEDFFLWGESTLTAPSPAPAADSADQFSAESNPSQAAPQKPAEQAPVQQYQAPQTQQQPPVQQYQAPQTQQQQPVQQYQAPLTQQQPAQQQYQQPPPPQNFGAVQVQTGPQSNGGNHNRGISASFGEVMGGSADLASVAESLDASLPHTPSMKTLEDLNAKCREAEDVSRDAESTKHQLQAQMNELRRVADEAESRARELADKPKKKGLLGRKKVDPKQVEKVAAEAREKKNALLQVQSQVNDAVALAAATKREADKLRKEADEAQIQAATAASMQQQQPVAAPAPQQQQPNQAYPPPNGYPPKNPGGPVPTFQPPQVNTNPAHYNANVMSNGTGVGIPTPNDDPFSNPFG